MTDAYTCPGCGNELKGFRKIRLSDGTQLCSRCTAKITPDFSESAEKIWTLKDFRAYVISLSYNNVFTEEFTCTDIYGALRLDREHRLIEIHHHVIPTRKSKTTEKDTVIDGLTVAEAEIVFAPEKGRNGLFGASASGKLYLQVTTGMPAGTRTFLISPAVTMDGRIRGIISKTFEPEFPEKLVRMQEALDAIVSANHEDDVYFGAYEKAADEFGLDLYDFTFEELFERRNELLRSRQKEVSEEQVNRAFMRLFYWQHMDGPVEAY